MMIFSVSVVNLPRRAESTNSEMAKVDEATPIYGGTLRTVGSALLRFNPLTNMMLCYNTQGIFDTLLTYDENCSLIPDLAEDYEASEDGLNLTFHLCENVSWHDGIEFNASDVKFTFDSILYDPAVDQDWTEYVFDVNSTEVINASTIVFHLDEPLGCLPEYLSYVPIVPRHIYEGTNLTTNYADPIGTGPFKFENLTLAPRAVTVTANEQYFRGRPYLDKIVFKASWSIPDITAVFENNALDLVGTSYLDPSRIRYLQSTPGSSITTKENTEYWCIYPNMSKPILQSKNVREAIAHAVNRTKIITEVFYGYASPAKGPLPASLPKWYNPNVLDYELNKTLAEELLDQEYPRGEDGWRFNLAMGTLISPTDPWRVDIANIIIDDLKSVGINATLQFMGMSGYYNFDDAFLGGWALDTFGPDDLYKLFHSSSPLNFGKYSNAIVDALLEEGRSSFNATLRKIDYDRAQEIIVEDLAVIFLYSPNVAMAYNNDFHGQVFNAPVSSLYTPYYLRGIWYDPTLSGEGNCPYRVCFTDSEGRRTGYHDGIVYEDIPDSTYSGMDSDPQLVKVREADGVYTVELFGTENASYKFEFANMALNYKNVRIPEGLIHENETITYIVKVFQDGSMKVYDYDKYSEHDIGMLSMVAYKIQSWTTFFNVTVFNWGNFTETFTVTIYANSTEFNVETVVLASGNSALLTFMWAIWEFEYGNYTISSYCMPVSGEIDVSDNNFTLGVVKVTIPGDINGDFIVDIFNAILLSGAFNTYPGHPNWKPNADINVDNIVDIYDAILLANHYGQHYP